MGARPVPRLAALAAALAVIGTACADPAAPRAPRPTPPDPRIRGTVVFQNPDGSGLRYQALPRGEPRDVELPGAVEFVPEAAVLEDVTFALTFTEDRGTVYRIPEGGAPSALFRVDNPGPMSSAGEHVAIGDCTRQVLRVIPVAGGPARDGGEGCIGTLSPDGDRVAYAKDGVIWRAPVGATVGESEPPTRWLVLDEVPGLSDLVPARERSVFEMAWGEPGIAVVVGSDERAAAVVATETGEARVIDLVGAVFVSFLRWQPGGPLLGIATGRTGAEGFVRVYDAQRDSIRTLALHPRGFVSAAWAPDGRSVVAVSGSGFFGSGPTGHWIYVDLEGRQFGTTRGGGAFIHAWLR